ncbi:MAG: O-antigen ligase family protein [Rhizomicrobium sp.]
MVWFYVAILAWSPFPLGGAISWGAGLQEILIALCWILWVSSNVGRIDAIWPNLRLVLVPLVLAVLVLAWACVQMLPIVPPDWAHPLWAMTSHIFGRQIPDVISINPWRTEAELLKLSSAVMACWLVFSMARHSETAAQLLNAVIVIGAAYALYGLVFGLVGTTQNDVFYAVPYHSGSVSSPFMNRNSFATYCGLATMAAITKLFALGNESIVPKRGPRQLALTIMQFTFGRGTPIVVATLLSLAGVVASASRAGFAATMSGIVALALTSLLVTRRGSTRLWTGAGALVAVLPLLFLVIFNGDSLGERLSQLVDAGTADNVRVALWAVTSRMIADAPWFGLGLGTFQDAYLLYATQVFPFVMDKAHCDYLEFAAGLGLPAAIAWWCAMAWLFVICIRGVRIRRRNRLYSLVAVGATVLVAVHSSVDFSLQMPAVALMYATLLGLGVAQAFPTHPSKGGAADWSGS